MIVLNHLGLSQKNLIFLGELIMNKSLVGLNKKELNALLTSVGVSEKKIEYEN